MADLGELGEFAEMGEESRFRDPMDPHGGVAGAAESAGNAAKLAIEKGLMPPAIPESILKEMPNTVKISVELSLEKIPNAPDSFMGNQIKSNVSESLKSPEEISRLTDNSLEDAAEHHGGDLNKITSEEFKNSLETNIEEKVSKFKESFKEKFKTALKDVDPSLDNKSASKFVDKMIDDPVKLKEELKVSADNLSIEELNKKIDTVKDPNMKSKLKEISKKLAGYGAKGLLILAVIGGIIPGAGGPIDKLAELAGDAIGKVVSTAAGIVRALFGPFISAVWKYLKVPLIVIALIFVFWVLKSFI